MIVCVLTDFCNPVAVVLVYPVRPTQIPQCGQVGHQCHGHPPHRSMNSFTCLICSCFFVTLFTQLTSFYLFYLFFYLSIIEFTPGRLTVFCKLQCILCKSANVIQYALIFFSLYLAATIWPMAVGAAFSLHYIKCINLCASMLNVYTGLVHAVTVYMCSAF